MCEWTHSPSYSSDIRTASSDRRRQQRFIAAGDQYGVGRQQRHREHSRLWQHAVRQRADDGQTRGGVAATTIPDRAGTAAARIALVCLRRVRALAARLFTGRAAGTARRIVGRTVRCSCRICLRQTCRQRRRRRHGSCQQEGGQRRNQYVVVPEPHDRIISVDGNRSTRV